MPDRRVFVTGGSGFIGTNLVARLVAESVAVANFDPAPPRNPAQQDTWRPGSLLDPDALATALTEFGPTEVVHLGARTDLDGADLDAYAANVAGVQHLIDAIAGRADLRRVVFASSRMVCRIAYQPTGDEDYCPNTVYGESKVEGERLVRGSGLAVPWVIVRPASIWGPWFDVPYRDFFMAIARRRYVHPRGHAIAKSFGFVGNTIHQIEGLLSAPADAVMGRTFYLADAPPLDVEHWAREIGLALGTGRPRQAPEPLLRLAARAGDVLERAGRKAPLTTFRLDNLLTTMIHDTTELDAVAGPPPWTLEQGVATTVAWLRDEQLV